MVDSKRGVLLELDFSDDELVVRQHPDGLYSVDVATGRLLVNEEQMRDIVREFARLGNEKGWLCSAVE